MSSTASLEHIACPCCGADQPQAWAEELGFQAVRCGACALIYVDPRPTLDSIGEAVRSGVHGAEARGLVVTSRRQPYKVGRYRRIFARLFADLWQAGKPVRWLDVGAGYGEVVEAVSSLAPAGSRIEGLEPMAPKAEAARRRGLHVTQQYLRPDHPKVDVVSVVDVFSHIPHFDRFLADVRQVLDAGGQLFMETGNLADLGARSEFPGELGLPDHLVFAGEAQLRRYLDEAGFRVVALEGEAVDGWVNLAKNVVKRLLGRPVELARPYSSRYRQLLVRAALK